MTELAREGWDIPNELGDRVRTLASGLIIYEVQLRRINFVELSGKKVTMLPGENAVLDALTVELDRVVPREELQEAIGNHKPVSPLMVHRRIASLRNMLGPYQPYLETIPEKGFVFYSELPGQSRLSTDEQLVFDLT